MKMAFVNDGAYGYASGAPWAVGGTERDIWRLARALAANGWTATVGVRQAMTSGECTVIDGVKYIGIGYSKIPGQSFLSWYRFLLSERPDWLFWEGASHLWGPLVEIAKLTGVRTIFHAAFDSDVRPRHALYWRSQWWPLYAWGLSRTDKIFVQHGGQLSNLTPKWRSKACILPKVCFRADTMTVKPHSERARYVAWVGMLRQHKRPDLLIEIAQRHPAITFVACGGTTTFMSPQGYGEQIVDSLHRVPNIEYLGQVEPKKAEQVIANAAILLSTSDQEGFPNTFWQAWCSGTPVISLKVDPDHVIERLQLGVVSGDVNDAIEQITALMDSPQRRDDIGARARQYIETNFSDAAVVNTLERAIRGVR